MDRDTVIEKHYKLVERIARQVFVRLPADVQYDDLVSAGTVGLIEAVDRFDEERGVRFRTFARRRIRGAMMDELRRLDVIPRHIREKENQLRDVRRQLVSTQRRPPTDDELCNALGWSLGELHELRFRLSTGKHESLDVAAHGDGSLTLHELREDREAVSSEEHSELQRLADEFRVAAARLPQRTQILFALYYIEDLTMQQIAVAMDLTVGRISQLHKAAVEQLREEIDVELDPGTGRLVIDFSFLRRVE